MDDKKQPPRKKFVAEPGLKIPDGFSTINLDDLIPHYKIEFPETEPIPLIPRLEEIIKQNEILNKTNTEICKTLANANEKIQSLESEAVQNKKSHKHDTIKNIAINVGIALLSVGLAILATKYGLLK